MKLTGNQLLAKIKFLTGSYDLLEHKGNMRDILVECGYIRENDDKFSEETSLRALGFFSDAYWMALKVAGFYQTYSSVHKKNGEIRRWFKKNFKHKLTEAEKEEKKKKAKERELYRQKNPPVKQGKVNQFFEEEIKKAYDEKKENEKRDREFNKRNLEFNKRKEKVGLLLYEKLTGQELLNESLKLWSIGKKEKDIAIITGFRGGYKRDNFRRAFAQAAGVELTSLNGMIKEMKEKEFLLDEKPKDIKNIEIIENSEKQEIFIDRTKITSQVKRLYRNPRFRENILKKHGSICICCGISMEKLIEAAHIIPVENKGNDDEGNGIPLCPTHHTAFDNFLFTINPTDNSIIYKEGLSSEDLQITKTECKLNVNKESLEYRYKLFNE